MASLHAFFAVALAAYWLLTSLLVDQTNIPYDRYLLFVVPVLTIWMFLSTGTPGATVRPEANSPRGWLSTAIAVSIIIGFGAFSVAGAHDYLAWNRVRWAAANSLMHEEHVQPQRIDGGYEFNGYLLYDPTLQKKPGKSLWIFDDEYVIATADLRGYRRIRDYPYGRWLPPYGLSVLVLHRAVTAD
jgi:hypothetical protein